MHQLLQRPEHIVIVRGRDLRGPMSNLGPLSRPLEEVFHPWVRKARLNTTDNNYEGAYDGDTVYVDIDQGFGDWKVNYKIRLLDIDTAERNSQSESEREQAAAARAFVIGVLTGEPLIIRTYKFRKSFDRYVGEVFYPDPDNPDNVISLNVQLLELGLAEPYKK